MIPPFEGSGFLPPGVFPATLAEIEARFGLESELRRVQMPSVRWMVELAVRAGVQRIALTGSFVTDTIEPNDVDCVLLFAAGKRRDRRAFKELRDGLPFLDLKLAQQDEFDDFVGDVFASDRLGTPKGMVEVLL